MWDLEAARCRFGKYLRVAVNGRAPDIARLVADYPPLREVTEQGELRARPGRAACRCVARARGIEATAELQLGEDAKFFPSDAALAGWMVQAGRGRLSLFMSDRSRFVCLLGGAALPGLAPAGESPFFASPKKGNRKKGEPDSSTLRCAAGTLRCSDQPGSG